MTKNVVMSTISTIAFCGILIGGILFLDYRHNTTEHGDDIVITEWISPDGVHYWYQAAGYHAMLAPRYDENGELVIDAGTR